MNMDFYTDAFEHRKLSQELQETPWWQALAADNAFKTALQRNYHMRVKMSDTSYLKQLLRSESERRAFLYDVQHPAPEHLAARDDD